MIYNSAHSEQSLKSLRSLSSDLSVVQFYLTPTWPEFSCYVNFAINHDNHVGL